MGLYVLPLSPIDDANLVQSCPEVVGCHPKNFSQPTSATKRQWGLERDGLKVQEIAPGAPPFFMGSAWKRKKVEQNIGLDRYIGPSYLPLVET